MNTLRKSVSHGPRPAQFPTPSQPQDIRYWSGAYPGPDAYYLNNDTVTHWVKLWIDPSKYWPNSTGGPDVNVQYQIDAQIAQANAIHISGFNNSPMYVWLTVLPNWPSWINGSTDPRKMPADVGPSSNWAYFIYYLTGRYSPNNANAPQNGLSKIQVLEITNEPNKNKFVTTQSDVPERMADMMKSAKQNLPYVGNFPRLAGPGLLDIIGGTEIDYNDFRLFAGRVLDRLAANGFYSLGNNETFMWSHHNYADVTYDMGAGCTFNGGQYPTTRSGVLYDLLVQKGWRGWPDGGTTPNIFCSEGGGQMEHIHEAPPSGWGIGEANRNDEGVQSGLWQNNWNRMKTSGDGRGVAMVTQYLWWTDIANQFDSGLFDNESGPPVTRYAYPTWKNFLSA